VSKALGELRLNMNHRYILPVIPEPKPGSASVLQFEGKGGMRGAGDIDLHCGRCNHRICEWMALGQVKNMVMRYPKCLSFNAVVDIPKFEVFVGLLHSSLRPAELPKFKKIIQDAVEEEKD